MKQLALALLLAVAPAAQAHCLELGVRSNWGYGGGPANYLRIHTFGAACFSAVEFAPFNGTIAAILIYCTHENMINYGLQLVGFEVNVPGCDNTLRVRSAGVWWDDRQNDPQPGDRLGLGGGLPQIDLVSIPTGWIVSNLPLALEPRIYRREGISPPHWNHPLHRPYYWAVAIVPERGYW